MSDDEFRTTMCGKGIRKRVEILLEKMEDGMGKKLRWDDRIKIFNRIFDDLLTISSKFENELGISGLDISRLLGIIKEMKFYVGSDKTVQQTNWNVKKPPSNKDPPVGAQKPKGIRAEMMSELKQKLKEMKEKVKE